MSLAPGDSIAGYTVIRLLGVGGMGAVYLVRHPRVPRVEALKLLRPEFAAEPAFAARFLHESDVAAGLSHRNLVDVLDRGEDAGRLWLTMRYVDGIDAETALEEAGGLLPAVRAVHIIGEVAAALDHVHAAHLVHRDVKPANILLAPGPADHDPESVFLTDFGIAKALDRSTKLTRTGSVIATLDYASPEQIESADLDARSDIYSLGCVLHRLLTGSVPYPGGTVAAAIHGHLTRPPPRPTDLVPWLAPALDDVVARAMSKNPLDRYATCRELATAAAQAACRFPPPPQPPYTVLVSHRSGRVPAVEGPVSTDAMSVADAERVVDLVQRTRFFDLPPDLQPQAAAAPAGDGPNRSPAGGDPVTIEVASTGVSQRVRVDLASSRRPPEIDDLVALVERTGSASEVAPARKGGPAPPTVIDRIPTPTIGSQQNPPPEVAATDRASSGRPRRRTRNAVLAVVALICLLGAGAGDTPTYWQGVAAYIGDSRITASQLYSAVGQRLEDPAVAEYADGQEDEFTRRVLSLLVQEQVHTVAAERYGVEVADADVRSRIDELLGEDDPEAVFSQLAEQGISRSDVFETVRQQLLRRDIALAEGAAEEPSEEELRAQYEEAREGLAEVRFGYITVPDQATADTVQAALQTDPSGYGAIAAQYPGPTTLAELEQRGLDEVPASLAEQVAAAEPNSAFTLTVDEIQGVIVAFVGETVYPSFEELRPQLEQEFSEAADAAGTSLVDGVREDLDVVINPRYGTLVDTGEIVSGD